MKSFDFKHNSSVFRNLKEDKKKVKRKINWDRFIYLSILLTLLFFAGRYFYFKLFYVKADGQIIFNSVDIQTLNDSRIVSLPVHEGDVVHIGDTLFLYQEDQDNNNVNRGISIGTNSTLSRNKDLIDIQHQIEMKQNQLQFMLIKLTTLKSKVEKTKQEVLLDALPKIEYQRLLNSIDDLSQEIELSKKEIEILIRKKNQLKSLKNSSISAVNFAGTTTQDESENKAFISPLDGTISKIFKENFEVTLRSEVVMHIYQAKGVIVKAFFQQNDYAQIKKGDLVDVIFPDGKKTKGLISMVLYETNRLPEEFQKKFEPTTRVINADIIPLSKNDLKIWKQYNKLSVIIQKPKY